MLIILREIIRILNESALYLLLGFALAGVLHVILNRYQRLTAMFTGRGQRSVYLAAIFGLPMPLCSCGVLPAALTLRKQGASKGATASFLISVPETDIISILLTYALLGPVLAVYRPLAALVTAIATGLVVNRVDTRAAENPEHASAAASPAHRCDDHCGHDAEGASDGTAESAPDVRPWYRRAFHFGFIEMFDDIIGQLLLGILIAAVLLGWLPGLGLEGIASGSPFTYVIMLLIGIPVYVCAVASTPIAVGLIAGGVSPGAVMVFLLAGPATNLASLIVLSSHFGRRVLTSYLVCIGVLSVFLGFILDRIVPNFTLPAAIGEVAHHAGAEPFRIFTSVILLVLAAISLRRTRLIQTWFGKIVKRLGIR
jgi:uncharacterized membrane protein YraQ (UPF0718 family)